MDFDSQYDLIEAYLEGEMQAKEKADFENRLLTDKKLQQAVKEVKGAKSMLEESASLFLKDKMRDFEQEEKGKIRNLFPWKFLSAAAIILLLVASYFWFSGPLSGPEAIKQNFEPYAASSLRGSAKMENLYNQALLAYENKDYKNAILYFSQLNADDPNYIETQLYLGNSFLAIKDYSSAIGPLEIVSSSKDLRFSEAGDWYLLLAYLGSERREDFSNLLARIQNVSSHGYKEKIDLLIDQIN